MIKPGELESRIRSALGEAWVLFMAQKCKGAEIVMPIEDLERIANNAAAELTIKQSMNVLVNTLRHDENYRHAWQANIATCMQDAWANNKDKKDDIHFLSNEGAKYFLNILCHSGEGTDDLPGSLAHQVVRNGIELRKVNNE